MGTRLFENAKLAKERTEEAEELQNSILSEYENEIDKYKNNEVTIKDYREHLICEYNMSKISNNIITDNTGNNINGNIIGNGLEAKKDIDGKDYIHLDGTTYIETEEINTLAGNTEKTIMCLFRTNDTSKIAATMLRLGVGATPGTGLATYLNNGYIEFETGTHAYWYAPRTYNVADNEWHFTCVTFNGTVLALYLDNEKIYEVNASLNTTNPQLKIGAYIFNGPADFIGDISDVRVYDKGLSTEEIYSIYSNIKK